MKNNRVLLFQTNNSRFISIPFPLHYAHQLGFIYRNIESWICYFPPRKKCSLDHTACHHSILIICYCSSVYSLFSSVPTHNFLADSPTANSRTAITVPIPILIPTRRGITRSSWTTSVSSETLRVIRPFSRGTCWGPLTSGPDLAVPYSSTVGMKGISCGSLRTPASFGRSLRGSMLLSFSPR